MGTTWIRVSTAAEMKGVRRQTIYYHIREGNLKSMDMDGNTYVDHDEVLRLKPRGKGEYKKRTPNLKTQLPSVANVVVKTPEKIQKKASEQQIEQITSDLGSQPARESRGLIPTTPEIALFQKTIQHVIDSLKIGQPVTLAPGEKLAAALAAGKQIVDKEMQRRANAGRRGGRPRKHLDHTPRSTLTMRTTRARRRAELTEQLEEIENWPD